MFDAATGKAKGKASTISCTNNLKQLGLGLMMYAIDNDDKLPANKDWEKTIAEHVGDAKAFVCPACQKHYAYYGNGQLPKDPSSAVILICQGDHEGKKNVLFADGHVATLSAADVDAAVKAAKNGALPVLK